MGSTPYSLEADLENLFIWFLFLGVQKRYPSMVTQEMRQDVSTTVEELYRAESRRILATLIRLVGDFDQAEDALHDAFRAALEQWPKEGLPANPGAWLISTGRFKAIDRLRRSRLEAP